jgi:hypothetical protein
MRKPLWDKSYPQGLRILVASALVWGFGGLALDIYSHVAGVWPWMQEEAVWGLGMAAGFALVLGVALWQREIEKAAWSGASRN